MRPLLLLLGVGLAVLWAVGWSVGIPAWLAWLEFVGAIWAVGVGIIPGPSRALSNGSAFVIGGGLMVLWFVALATHVGAWVTWWTFAFGVAFLVAAAIGVRPSALAHRPSHA